MGKTFIALTSKKISENIRNASKRVAFVGPSVHVNVAEALCHAAAHLGKEKVEVVTDLDEKVFRLGYGSIEAIKMLKENDIKIRNHKGLRIGLVVCDENAWSFSPVALYIETEPVGDDLPNALVLSANEATRILFRISDAARSEVIKSNTNSQLVEEAKEATVELSQFSDNSNKLEEVCKSLEDAPPVSFDVSRQVQVFEPYIQYVEPKLQGCSIQKHKIQLPKSIIGLASNKEVEERLSTTFNLIEKSSSLSAKHLEDDVRKLRNDFTRVLGKHGRVMLKAQRKKFDEKLENIRGLIKTHQQKIKDELEGELANSMNQLIDYYLPIVMERPPSQLAGQLPGDKPTKQQACAWLADEIGKCIPNSDKLITKMELECFYKDVTYETLREPELANSLKKEFPYVNWDKPFNEFTAAKATDNDCKSVKT